METSVVTAPDAGLVTLDDAKAYLGVSGADEDTLISTLILAASNHVCGPAGVLNRSFRQWSYRARLSCFPAGAFYLPYTPIIEVTSFSYTDNDDAAVTLAEGAGFRHRTEAGVGYVEPVDDDGWPTDQKDGTDITLDYTAGDPDNVPKEIEVAVKMLVQNMFDHRDTILRGGVAGITDNAAFGRLIANHDFSVGA